MDSVFFEKQEGALCAQHALNALLQGAYFTAVDLASIARTLDNDEREVLGQGGAENPEYLRAFQQDSYNMDDTGFFFRSSDQCRVASLEFTFGTLYGGGRTGIRCGTSRSDVSISLHMQFSRTLVYDTQIRFSTMVQFEFRQQRARINFANLFALIFVSTAKWRL